MVGRVIDNEIEWQIHSLCIFRRETGASPARIGLLSAISMQISPKPPIEPSQSITTIACSNIPHAPW